VKRTHRTIAFVVVVTNKEFTKEINTRRIEFVCHKVNEGREPNSFFVINYLRLLQTTNAFICKIPFTTGGDQQVLLKNACFLYKKNHGGKLY